MKYYEKSLEIKWTILGKDHPDSVLTLFRVGKIYVEQGKLDSGLEKLNEVIAIQYTLSKFDITVTVKSLKLIGHVYLRKGNSEKAINAFTAVY